MSIPVNKPTLKRKDLDSVLSCMVADSLSPGQNAQKIVDSLREYLSREGGAAFREPSRALENALKALAIEPGSGVALSALSPDWFRDAVERVGLVPVIVDILPQGFSVDFDRLSALAAEGAIKAIVIPAPLGYPTNVEKLEELELPIIEDISQSLGARTQTRMLGATGHYTLVGLEQNDLITGGGGCIVLARSRREALALRRIVDGLPEVMMLPEMNAALAVSQMHQLSHFLELREEYRQLFHRSLMQSKHSAPMLEDGCEMVPYGFPVITSLGLKDVVSYAMKKGIETLQPFSRTVMTRMEEPGQLVPNAWGLSLRMLLFPLYPTLGKKNAELITKVLSTLP